MRNYRQDFVPGQYYHVYNRSNNKEKIFPDVIAKHTVVDRTENYLSPHSEIETFNVLDNHFHSFLKLKELSDQYLKQLEKLSEESKAIQYFLEDPSDRNYSLMISGQFQRCYTSIAMRLNHCYGRNGNLINHRFKHLLVEPKDWHYTIAYIHNNPRHHGYTKNVYDWQYSGLNQSDKWKKHFPGKLGRAYHQALMDLVQARKTNQVECLSLETLETIKKFEQNLHYSKFSVLR